MSLPTDRKYTESHEWVKAEGDVFVVGITDTAQDQLGDLVFVGDVKVGASWPPAKPPAWSSRSRPPPTSTRPWPARSSPSTKRWKAIPT